MSLLFASHKVAAQRGDGLRPELLRLLENSKAEKEAAKPALKIVAPKLARVRSAVRGTSLPGCLTGRNSLTVEIPYLFEGKEWSKDNG
jgi:hypothetical protein